MPEYTSIRCTKATKEKIKAYKDKYPTLNLSEDDVINIWSYEAELFELKENK
jgi:hypothetical protein